MLGGNVSKFSNLIQSCIVQVPMNGKVDGGYVGVLRDASDDWTFSEMCVEFVETTPILYKCAMTFYKEEPVYYIDNTRYYNIENCTQYVSGAKSCNEILSRPLPRVENEGKQVMMGLIYKTIFIH